MTSIPGQDPVRLLGDLDFVRSLARQLCRDDAEADDLTQATAAAALAKAPADVVSWRAWLATVARNLLRNRRRAERVVARGRDMLRVEHGERHAPSAAEVAAQEELRRRVVAAVMALPDEFREVVLLRHYRDLDTREAAQELGVPEATVRSRLKRGLDRIRQRLDAEHSGDRRAWVGALLPLAVPARAAAATVGIGSGTRLLAVAAVLLLASGGLWWAWRDVDAVGAMVPVAATVDAGAATPALAAVDAGPPAAEPQLESPARVAAEASPDVVPWTLQGSVVLGEDERLPVAGATVRMVLDLPGLVPQAPRELGTVRTGADGTFFGSLAAVADLPDARLGRLAVHLHVDVDGGWQQHAGWVMLRRIDPLLVGPVVLTPGRFVKGRVVDPHGEPVEGASFGWLTSNGRQRALTRADGRFTLEVGDVTVDGGQRTMFAYAAEHGFSRALFARVDAARDLQLGDVVVQHPLHELTGRVHHPDGTGAAGVAVDVSFVGDWRGGDVVAVDGVQIPGFCAFSGNVNNNQWRVRTDSDGCFAVRTLRAGRHELRITAAGLQREIDVTHGTEPVDVVLGKAHIDIRAVDEFDLPVPLPGCRAFVWRGAAADEAERRYRDGPDDALLLSGDPLLGEGGGPHLSCDPDCFVVVTAPWPLPSVAGTRGFGACRLGPDQWRGVIDVRPVVPPVTGELAFDVRDASGAAVGSVLCKLRSESGLAIDLDAPPGPQQPWTTNGGRWSQLPPEGRLTGLPCGVLELELLAGVTLRDGEVEAAPFVLARQQVEVTAACKPQVRVVVERGVVPVFVLQLPEPLADERLSRASVQAFCDNHDGALSVLELVPGDAGGWPRGELPRTLELRARRAIAPGTYTVRLSALRAHRVESTDVGEQVVARSEHALHCEALAVHVTVDTPRITVSLRRS